MSTSRYADGKTVSAVTCFDAGLHDYPRAASHLAGQQAATEQTPISYEGQRVTSVQVAGQPDLSRRAVADLLSQPENAPYHQQEVDRTVEALKNTGKYTNVKVLVTPEANGLRVSLRTAARLLFRYFHFFVSGGAILLSTSLAGRKLSPSGTLHLRTGG